MNRTLLLIFVITLNGFGQTFQFYDDVEQDQIEPQSMEFIQNPILQDKIILEEPVDPRTYIVGPGDTFSFNMVSADGMVNLLLEVSPIGDVLVPVVGLISVKDLSLTEAFEQIKSQCLMKYSNASVYLTLTKIRQFKVLITGTVNHPGFIVVNPFIRVSDVMERVFDGSEGSALIFSDQPMDKISLRNIKLSRGDQIIRVDLIKFNMTGNLDLNPRVAAGDVISIGMSNGNTRIYGGVKIPGIYEFVEGETLYDLIRLAGGFTNNADSARVEITRFINDTEKQIIQISEISDLSNTVLMPEDHIIVRMKQDYKRQEVITILGEIKYPGKYALQDHEMTVGKIIEKAGGYASRADRTKIIVNNQSIAKLQDIEFKRIMLVPYEDRSDAEKAYVKARSRTTKGTISSSSQQYTDTIMDFPLQIDDIVFIPPLQEYVELLGAVVYPGRYPLIAGKSIQEYIEDAGGKTKRASRQRYIVKNSTGQRIPFDETDTIENGDVIFIAEKLEYNLWTRIQEVMTVGGQMAAIIIVIQNAVR